MLIEGCRLFDLDSSDREGGENRDRDLDDPAGVQRLGSSEVLFVVTGDADKCLSTKIAAGCYLVTPRRYG